jgi:dipeptidyl aminopeptidase/acylaminoacyl peptidase
MGCRSNGLLAAGALLCAVVAPPAWASCPSLLNARPGTFAGGRPVDIASLVELNDIGLAGTAWPGSPLGLSADGRRVAFQIRRADVASNSYCFAMVVMDVDGARPPVEVDLGGDFIFVPGFWTNGITSHISGYALPIRPAWSPDGKWIAYLRRDQGATQVWRASAVGGHAERLTNSPLDVQALQWSADGRSLHYWVRPGYAAEQRAISQEGLAGFRYDDRAFPSDSSEPMVIDRSPAQEMVFELADGTTHVAAPSEAAYPSDVDPMMATLGALPAGDTHDAVQIMAWDKSDVNAGEVVAARSEGRLIRCEAEACRGRPTSVWRPNNGTMVYFLKREGWANGDIGLYRWSVGTKIARRLLSTEALISGCVEAALHLTCMAESALRPRYVVRIDLRTGRQTELFDPNPDFARRKLGEVQRLRWVNDIGLEAFGDLVLPPDHQAGQRHPLVIVQYDSRGFLRGGTGDAYPIQVMAAAGYAVLSTQMPKEFSQTKPARSLDDLNRNNTTDFADDKIKLSSLETGVRAAVATGTVDPASVAITGLSDGAAKARYALLHSKTFKVGLISSCCDDETALSLVGPAHAADFRSYGYPGIADKRPDFWKELSFLEDPDAFDTPLLVQASDHEYLLAVATYTGLRERKKPIALYVFPDEHHVLWQPAHRAAAYQRDIDWLDFWMRGKERQAPAARAQYDGWEEMRAEMSEQSKRAQQ